MNSLKSDWIRLEAFPTLDDILGICYVLSSHVKELNGFLLFGVFAC